MTNHKVAISEEKQRFLDSHFLGDISYGDMFRVSDDVKACAIRHGGFTGEAADTVLDEYQNAINVGDFGRAVGLDLHDAKAFHPEMIAALQTEVLQKWNDWKIQIAMYSGDGSPLVVSVGEVSTIDGLAVTHLDEFLENVVRNEQAARDIHDGPIRFQFQEITKRLGSHISHVTEEHPFSVLAIFDNYRAKSKYLAIYLLSNSEWGEVCVHIPDADRKEAREGGGSLTVDESGAIHKQKSRFINGVDTPIEGKLWIHVWLIPSGYAGNKLAVTRDSDCKRWEIDFSQQSVIRGKATC